MRNVVKFSVVKSLLSKYSSDQNDMQNNRNSSIHSAINPIVKLHILTYFANDVYDSNNIDFFILLAIKDNECLSQQFDYVLSYCSW